MPSLTLNIEKKSPLHRKIVTMIGSRVKFAKQEHTKQHDKWSKAEETILAYVHESDDDAWRRHQREHKGRPAYTTMRIPYSFALLMSAHTYWTSVFFARNPVHQFSGNHGEGQNQVQALEALISYQVNNGGAMAPYYIWLYDAGKYGVGILGEYWDEEEIWYSVVDDIPDPETGETTKMFIEHSVPGFEGNRCYNVSPWDFYPDPRFPVSDFQKGEFCFVEKRLSWTDLLQRKRQGFYTNIEHVKSSVQDRMTPDEQSSALERPTGSYSFHENEGDKPAVVRLYEFYAHIVPEDWGLPGTQPQKWVFTITSDLATLIGVQPLGAMHGKFPFSVLEPEVEAYGSWNRGIPEMIEPIQNTMDWLLNSHMYNVRAVLNNLFIADPTKIVMKDLESPGAGGTIRLKPEAYGQDIRSFITQVPIQDITQTHVTDLGVMQQLGERMTGINDQIQGVLTGSGRRTATEVRQSTGFGVNRLKTISEYMSATGFSQHARRLVVNSQQYYSTEKQLRIVGDLANNAGQGFLNVTPESIVGSYDVVPVDGTLPIDRMAQASLWKELIVGLRAFPQVFMQYDIGRIFSWIASLSGIKNIEQFKFEIQPDEQLMQDVAAGNVVPYGGRGPNKSNPRTTGIQPVDNKGAA